MAYNETETLEKKVEPEAGCGGTCIWKTEAGSLQVPNQPRLHSKTLCQKKKKK
jgi:hypothetical protein